MFQADSLDLNSDMTTCQPCDHDHVIKVLMPQYLHLTNKDNNDSYHMGKVVLIKGNDVCSTLKLCLVNEKYHADIFK